MLRRNMCGRRRRQCGQSGTVEMALILPVFIMVLMGIIECSRGLYVYTVVSNAAREGARYGIIHPTWETSDDNPDPDNIEAHARALTVGLRASDLTITIEYPDGARKKGNRVRVTAVYQFTTIVPVIQNFSIGSSAAMEIE